MKYFRYVGIIDEYVMTRAENFDSATIMKMKWRELPVPLAIDERYVEANILWEIHIFETIAFVI